MSGARTSFWVRNWVWKMQLCDTSHIVTVFSFLTMACSTVAGLHSRCEAESRVCSIGLSVDLGSAHVTLRGQDCHNSYKSTFFPDFSFF